MSRRGATKLARPIVAIAALAALAAVTAPDATTAVVDWVAAHDMVDIPYVRDCHGILRRPEECPGAGLARRDGAD